MKKILQFALFVILCVALYVGFDFLYARFIAQRAFEFSWGSDVIVPVTTAIVVGELTLFRKDRTGKDE